LDSDGQAQPVAWKDIGMKQQPSLVFVSKTRLIDRMPFGW